MIRTYGTTVDVSIAAITSAYLNAKEPGDDGTLYLLHTPIPADDAAKPLIRVHLFIVRAFEVQWIEYIKIDNI